MNLSVDLSENMLLTDFKQVLDIDSAIIDLHKDLENLYKQRTRLFDNKFAAKTFAAHYAATSSERQQYDKLAASWNALKVTIPPFSKLQKKLAVATSLLNKYNQSQPELLFQMILVPPTSVYAAVDLATALKCSPEATILASKSRDWKLYIVATNQRGLEIKDHRQFMQDGGMMVDDVFMTGLNTYEYSVMLSVIKQPIDADSWSILVRDASTKLNVVPCVTHLSGFYSIEVDNTDVLLGENHFRPAMKVN
jgi:hypothetical protein